MSDSEKSAKSAKAISSGRNSPVLLTVPIKNDEAGASVAVDARLTRSSSPVLATELVLKVKTQMSRVSSMQAIIDFIPDSHEDAVLAEVESWISQTDELHKAFIKEHAYLEVSWPAAFVDHEYFAADVHQREARLTMEARTLLSKLKGSLTVQHGAGKVPTEKVEKARAKLPDISLPKFSGEYLKWPAFRDMFDSLILRNDLLCKVEKLHYLRGCIQGSAAQLIQGFSLTADSLDACWELLTSRYENKRLIVQAQLDRLFSISSPSTGDASSLNKVVSTMTEVNAALQTLGMADRLGDCIMVHHISKHLDRTTRELWETSLGSSQEFPKFQELESFLIARVRTLERIGEASAQPTSSKNTSKKALTAQRGSSQPKAIPKTAAYGCDCCNADHYIVTCAKFRSLTVADRRKLAVSKWLCFNCLGRHNVRSCKSKVGCKQCSGKHHTMLHDSLQTSSSATPSSAVVSTAEASH